MKNWQVTLHIKDSCASGCYFPVVFSVVAHNAEQAKEAALTDAFEHVYEVNYSEPPNQINFDTSDDLSRLSETYLGGVDISKFKCAIVNYDSKSIPYRIDLYDVVKPTFSNNPIMYHRNYETGTYDLRKSI